MTRRPLIRASWLLLALPLSVLACKTSPETDPSPSSPSPSPSASAPPARPAAGRPNEPSPAPASDFTEDPAHPGLRVISGPAFRQRLRQTRAKATLVNVWASWCGPCRREFPMLVALRDNLAAQGVDLVFVSVDEPDGYGVALEFAGQNGQPGPLWVAERPLGLFKEAMSPKWKGALPASFLFDGAGELRYFWNGEVFDHEVTPVVDALLRGEDVDGVANLPLMPGRDYRQP